jgi:hypothetical protein
MAIGGNKTTITVDFDEQGNPSIEVGGVSDKSCHALTDALEKALGRKTADVAKHGGGDRVQQQVVRH